jgi:transcriptional regulator with AAA-type ATPase domain
MTTLDTVNVEEQACAATECGPADPEATGSSRLIVALDCNRPTVLGRRVVLAGLDEVIVVRESADRNARSRRTAALFLSDSNISRQHLAVRRTPSGWRLDDLGSRNGTFRNGKLVDSAMLADGDLIEAGSTMLVFRQDDKPWRDVLDRDLMAEIDVASPTRTLHAQLEQQACSAVRIAPSRVPVLIRGETGTGKELMARAIHDASGRRGPFVAVNCGGLSHELLHRSLFGCGCDAVPDAPERREGLIQRAHRGTLFLDEVAELSPDSQAALLRFLHDGEVRPVGASDVLNVDVRVVSATHQDVQQRIADGLLRHDFYGRIAGYEVRLPPLRDRREDLGMLIAAILSRLAASRRSITLHKAAARALFGYSWPLNIRELEHALEVALALSEDHEIRVEHLPSAILEHALARDGTLTPSDRALRSQLLASLRQSRGNIAAVARVMDRAPVQIRRWCRRLQIDPGYFRARRATQDG